MDEQELQPLSAATNVSNSDKIRQALLDISMFRSREESCTLEAQAMAPGHDTKDERTFIRGVLCAARFLSTPGSSPNWHDKDVAIDPSLFDKLESGDVVEFSFQAAGGLRRCDRKLLFDCVNEAFGVTRLWHCHSGPERWLEEELVSPCSFKLTIISHFQLCSLFVTNMHFQSTHSWINLTMS